MSHETIQVVCVDDWRMEASRPQGESNVWVGQIQAEWAVYGGAI